MPTGDILRVTDSQIELEVTDQPPESSPPHPWLNQVEFDDKYGKVIPPKVPLWKSKLTKTKQKLKCSRQCWGKELLSLFPFINMFATYKPRKYLLGDIISGISVGVMTVPQSMGYALLASLPPIVGLYTSVFPVIVYFFFGPTPHASVGTMGVTSLVLATCVNQEMAGLRQEVANSTGNRTIELIEQLYYEEINVATSVTFVAGIMMLVMSFLKLGFLADYMGDSFMSGFISGCNMHVLLGQIKYMLGIKVGLYTGALKYVYTVIDIFKYIGQTNVATLIMSIIAFATVYLVKKCINERFQAKLPVPVPIELIVVTIGILVAHFGKMSEKFGIEIVGHIPQGVPIPMVPPKIPLVKNYILEAFMVGFSSYVINIVMCRVFAKRHNYKTYDNKEMFALGLADIFSCFFQGIGTGISPPRCFLMESTGGRTQIAFLVSATLIVLVLFFLAPLLEGLPICILAVLIFVSCIPLFEQYLMSVYYFKVNKVDFSIWFVSFTSTVLIDIERGMVIGGAYSLLTVLVRTRNPYISLLGMVEGTQLHLSPEEYSSAENLPGIKILRFESPLCFVTLSVFRQKLAKILKQAKKEELTEQNSEKADLPKDALGYLQNGTSMVLTDPGSSEIALDTPLAPVNGMSRTNGQYAPLHTLIVDCSTISYIDAGGATFLAHRRKELKAEQGVTMVLASCNTGIRKQFLLIKECADLYNEGLFATLQDAIMACQLQNVVDENGMEKKALLDKNGATIA